MTFDTTSSPSFLEEHISRIPALQMLQNLGYAFLRPQDAHLERKGRLSNLLLEGILESQLRRLNRIRRRDREHEFSDANIQAAIEALRNVSLADGLMAASRRVHDLLTTGKTLEQTIDGDTKSYPFQYVDWGLPRRNTFHAVEEFEVLTQGGRRRRTPDLVLFVNGIPFAVLECGQPDDPDAIPAAVSQHLRNQADDQIPRLFAYAQLLLAINATDATYATTGTRAEAWTRWREDGIEADLVRLANQPLTRQQKENLYAGRSYLRQYFDGLELEERPATAQDAALVGLCRPDRLLELVRQFIVFRGDEKLLARHAQFFAVKKTIERIRDPNNRGGVIWHARGTGTSVTTALLVRVIVHDPEIHEPRIVLVTDRTPLAELVQSALKSSGKELVRATTGKQLLELLSQREDAFLVAAPDKFETAVRAGSGAEDSAGLFLLVDERHRGADAGALARIQRAMPQASYLGVTGVPLNRRDREAAEAFGGMLDAYPIDQALRDRVLVPLLYENRRTALNDDVDAGPRIRAIAEDLSAHFSRNIPPPFKALLAADSEADAQRYKECLDALGQITSEVLLPGAEASGMIRNVFLHRDDPKLLISAGDALPEFDAPHITTLYLDRKWAGYALLEAITRVNRICEGKEFGFVLDYCGAFAERNGALDLAGALPEFDPDVLALALRDIAEETARLSRRHADLWALFEGLANRADAEAFERRLGEQNMRMRFYEAFSVFNRTMRVAFSSAKFLRQTAGDAMERYKQELLFFQQLRMRVKRRYADELDFPVHEAGLQKLLDAHGPAGEHPPVAAFASLFDRRRFDAEIEAIESVAAKADTIAHRTRKAIAEKVEEDPFFYRRLGKVLADAMEEWRQGRDEDAVYLRNAAAVMETIRERAGAELPAELQQHETAQGFYGVVRDVLAKVSPPPADPRTIALEAALAIDRLIREHRVVDWRANLDVQNEIRNRIDDMLDELKARHALSLSLDEMDGIVEGALAFAKARYS
jgi:type I restriction enzyme, R subunit